MKFTTKTDTCGCRCMANGVVATVVINLFLWTALILSGMTVMDCEMIEARIFPEDDRYWPPLPESLVGLTDGLPSDRRRFGFFIHEDADGDCRWEYWASDTTTVDGDEIEDYIRDYTNWMGSGWERAARIAVSASGVALLVIFAAGFLFCVAHLRALRWMYAAVAIIAVFPLQICTLMVLGGDFCKGRDCELRRTGFFAIVAGALVLLAGAMFFCLEDYPGCVEEEIVKALDDEEEGMSHDEAEKVEIAEEAVPDEVPPEEEEEEVFSDDVEDTPVEEETEEVSAETPPEEEEGDTPLEETPPEEEAVETNEETPKQEEVVSGDVPAEETVADDPLANVEIGEEVESTPFDVDPTQK